VVFIVPANIGLRQIVSRDSREYSVDHLGLFFGRDHESYLIQVGKSKRLYWPLVKHLKPVEPSPLEQYKQEAEPWNADLEDDDSIRESERGNYATARGHDLHSAAELGDEHVLFWLHLEGFTGKVFSEDHREKMGWSCTC